MAPRYFNLVLADQTKERVSTDVAWGLISTLDIYESFHLVQKQSSALGDGITFCLHPLFLGLNGIENN